MRIILSAILKMEMIFILIYHLEYIQLRLQQLTDMATLLQMR